MPGRRLHLHENNSRFPVWHYMRSVRRWEVHGWQPLTLLPWQGYLAALSASAYSYVSMLQRFGPLMNRGGAAVSLTYLASERIVPGAPGTRNHSFLLPP